VSLDPIFSVLVRLQELIVCRDIVSNSFLGEAFGDPEPHPADDPSNNPFAEGGVDAPPSATHERRARSEPGAGNADQGGGGAGAQGAQAGRGNPLNYLFSLMNSFGINGQMLGANGFGLPGNAGDYVWGGEANFQNLLNDLMEQVSSYYFNSSSALADTSPSLLHLSS